MKNRILALLCLLALTLPTFAAAGTEGREFWVALTLGRGPQDKGNKMQHYICVSSKSQAGQVIVTNPQSGWTDTLNIAANSWLEIRNIPQPEIYPYPADTTRQQRASGRTFNTGIKVTSTVDVSVFAALRYENAFDASNILPITALQSNYIVQDYPAFAHQTPTTSFSNFCVLAIEDNTQIEITPYAETYDHQQAGQTFTITLNAGQVYYVVSQQATADDSNDKNSADSYSKSLSGSTVKALNGKKIAVFNGDICTRTPNFKGARDMHYEQAIPTDYWGREFILTRSKQKDANRFRITAQENGTHIYLNGATKTLNALETYELELAVAADMEGLNTSIKDYNLTPNDQFVQDAMYIHTSCPVAIYNYDTGNEYKSKGSSEMNGSDGDPSMTWISPLEQKISEITFGVMGTKKTKDHFVNIITETSNTASMHIYQANGNDIIQSQAWQVVPNNPTYSYLRQHICTTDGTDNGSNPTFTIKGAKGFIAHVYGNGDDESYAYSCGSAAVKRGLQIDNNILLDGDFSNHTYCLGEEIEFNAQVGSDQIDSTIWDFGDGVKMRSSNPVQKHTYDATGWYNMAVTVFASKECPDAIYPPEVVNVRFYVGEPDTIRRRFFICEGETFTYNNTTYTESTPDTAFFGCDSVVIFTLEVGKKSLTEIPYKEAHDSLYWNGKWYYDSADSIEWHGINAVGCDSLVRIVHLHVLTCLSLTVSDILPDICGDETNAAIPYTRIKGDLGNAALYITDGAGGIVQQIPLTIDVDNSVFYFDATLLRVGHYEAFISVEDPVCGIPFLASLEFNVRYPSSVFAQKWDDVLAVKNAQYNGGYTFVGFQWFKNGEPIEGATGSVYQSPQPLSSDDEYSVMLTTVDGTTSMSCTKTGKDASPAAAAIHVSPTIVEPNGQIQVQTTQAGNLSIFNTLGVLELQTTVEQGITTFHAPTRNGIFVLQITLEDGTTQSMQVMVK